MRPIIVGEAPSRLGDGRAFTGPSGERLQRLLGLKSYDQLAEIFDLRNLLDHSTPHWKLEEQIQARTTASELRRELADGPHDLQMDVILCGRRVLRYFNQGPLFWFDHVPAVFGVCRATLWTFPHPSGLNHFWNNSANVERASEFLRARALASCSHSAFEQCPVDLYISQAPLRIIP